MSDPASPSNLAAYWQQHIDQWKISGQSQAKFCQTKDLSYHRFVYWRYKFEHGPGARQETRKSGGFATVYYRMTPIAV